MFKHRLSKFGKASFFAVCMLLVGGTMNSCQDKLDEYKYDNEEPSWLGASIYDFLKEGSPGHTYKNFVAIIDSLGEKDVLSHTGSKTLFVADDAAFAEFYKKNPWGVKSVGDMTKSQMKVLLYNAMLNDVLQIDMLSNTGITEATEGTCLRRSTSSSPIDTVPLLDRNLGKSEPTYNRFWDALRGKDNTEKIRLVMDGSETMMVHIFTDYLKKNAIEASDIAFLFKKNGTATKTFVEDEAIVFDKKLVASGVETGGFTDDTMTITCKNGSIFRLDGVLLPPSNMAQELRMREDTKVYSHLLDRFCIPELDETLTREYRNFYKTDEEVYKLRYFTKGRFARHSLLEDAQNPVESELLDIDPGWNANSFGTTAKESDMAAMLVPKDDVMYEYFASGAGNFLVQHYAPNVEIKDLKSLLQALDAVPETKIAEFINNTMQVSFINTVVSKFERVTNTAKDPMGLAPEHVDECVIANNGVIYILNNVFGPPQYQAVHGPTSVLDNMQIMDKFIKQMKYEFYLLAMDVDYSLLIPDDGHFVYYDPATFEETPTVYTFHYDNTREGNNRKEVELWAEADKFDKRTYELIELAPNEKLQNMFGINLSGIEFANGSHQKFMKSRATDLLDYLVVVHGDEGEFVQDKKYYQTKGYGFIKVDYVSDNDIKIYGGEQLENGTVINVRDIYAQQNGNAYCTVPSEQDTETRKYSGIPTPPTKNIKTRMEELAKSESDIFHEFYNICIPDGVNFTSLFKKMLPGMTETAVNDSIEYYSVFYSTNDNTKTNIVPFLNTYHYTVYVPSNESVKSLQNEGLPTWTDVEKFATKYPGKAMSMTRLINNFIRYHFQDNSVFYESGRPFSVPSTDPARPYMEADYSTSLINDSTGRFYEVNVKSNVGNTSLVVTDQLGNEVEVDVSGVEGQTYNIMARDIVFEGSSKNFHILSSSYSVIHPLQGALKNYSLYGYDGRFRRFTSSGELVDLMKVDGESEPYLVGRLGEVVVEDVDASESVIHAGYILTPIDKSNKLWDEKFTREDFIIKDDKALIVTADGYLIEPDDEAYVYVTELDDNGNTCKIKVDKNGEVKERVPVTE